jgi:replicative DNA helicase
MIEKPHDLLLERDVLGSCLLRPDMLLGLGLSDDDFASESHRCVWVALSEMVNAGESVDLIRLRSKLVAMDALQAAGGESALEKLRYVTKPNQLPVERLKELTRLRAMRKAAEEIAAKCAEADAEGAISALSDAHGVALAAVQKKRTQNAYDLCTPLLDEIAQGVESVPRIHPGYVIMEEKLGSIPQGCTVAVLASTNVGKSSLVLEMLVRAAQRNVTCGYLSVEDQEPVVRSRLVGMLSGVSSRAILERKLNASDFDRIGKAYEELKKLRERLHVSILQGGTDVDVCSSLSELAAKGCKLVAVDYIQKVTASRTYQNKAHEVSASATRITSHAQRLGLACVVVSQCGRDKTRLNECPSKHDMKESGDLENMVDAIIGLWREHESDVAPIKARLLKVKWGGVGDQWELKRNTRTGRLEEVT